MIAVDRTQMLQGHSPFPASPVLTDVARFAASLGVNWSQVGLICVQHLLASTGTLVDTLIELGVSPRNILIAGKSYSTNAHVVAALRQRGVEVFSTEMSVGLSGFQGTFADESERLWASAARHRLLESCKQTVIVDDGGHCIAHAPSDAIAHGTLVAVEQTTAGIRRLSSGTPIPVVNVAQSAAKTALESPLISEVILEKTSRYLTPGSRIGVVGVGNIGASLVTLLQERGYGVSYYDSNTGAIALESALTGVAKHLSLHSLIDDSDVVFGCTGTDAFGSAWFEGLKHDLTLASCSSEDLEFRSLISHLRANIGIDAKEGAENIVVRNHAATVTIVRGGFPVNFDGSPESVPTADIQLTRGLLLGAIAQALIPGLPAGISMLAPTIQQYVVRSWLRHRPERVSTYPPAIVRGFSQVDWIRSHSSSPYHQQAHVSDDETA